jgi:predicted AAA+ superfamily ATPase
MMMSLPTVFDLCTPRDDVLDGTITDSDFAANLARVLRGDATPDYLDPKRFFANTYPTEGLKGLLANVCGRLSGKDPRFPRCSDSIRRLVGARHMVS